MLRGLALLVIIIACGIYGLIRAHKYVQRPKQLRAFHQALESLTTEINYGLTPLPEAMLSAAKGIDPTVGQFFLLIADKIRCGVPAHQAWADAATAVGPSLCLDNEDWQVIMALAVGLGTTDKTEEKKKLQLCTMRLLAHEQRAVEQGTRLAKLWSYMGFLTGATIALIII